MSGGVARAPRPQAPHAPRTEVLIGRKRTSSRVEYPPYSIMGLLCGVIAALKRNRWSDRVIMILSLLGTTIPTFVIASVLQYYLSVK